MPPVGFEPTISASEQPQTYALDHVATGIGTLITLVIQNLEDETGGFCNRPGVVRNPRKSLVR